VTTSLTSVREMVTDGMRIGIGGFWFVRTPTALVDEVVASGATDLEIVCFGGGLGVERLLELGRVKTLYFSFHSMDVLGAAPQFRRAVEAGAVRAVELTTLVMSKALTAAQENLPFLPVLGPLGSEFLDGDFPLTAFDCPVTGRPLYAVPALPLDLCLIHAPCADEAGNVELAGARGLDRRLFGAARTRVVSVEEVTGDFSGPQLAHRTTLPRFLVDHVVKAPGGAAPSSCLPYYPTDFTGIRASLGTRPPEDPMPVSEATVAPRSTVSAAGVATPAERMAFLLARQLVDGGVYTVGSVTPLSMVAYQLAKRTHAPDLALIPFAGLVDVGTYRVGVQSAESSAAEGAHDFWGMDDLYEWLYQAGRIDAEIFCPAQIDQRAHINNSQVRRADGTVARLPGQAGIADVATLHRNLYMYVPRHSSRRLVQRVDFEGGARELVGDDEREAVGLHPGEVTVVTDLCVLRLDKGTRLLRLDSLHGGVSLADAQARTGFDLGADFDVPPSPEPPADILRLIRDEIDPLGVRQLETVRAAERGPLLHSLLLEDDKGRWPTADGLQVP
jgi:glutaconate CoA-transferase, subunit A